MQMPTIGSKYEAMDQLEVGITRTSAAGSFQIIMPEPEQYFLLAPKYVLLNTTLGIAFASNPGILSKASMRPEKHWPLKQLSFLPAQSWPPQSPSCALLQSSAGRRCPSLSGQGSPPSRQEGCNSSVRPEPCCLAQCPATPCRWLSHPRAH
eukprot:1162035-Pelagomonas_calceolata.AAC.14